MPYDALLPWTPPPQQQLRSSILSQVWQAPVSSLGPHTHAPTTGILCPPPPLFRGQASKPGHLPTMGTTWKDWHHPNGSSTGRSCPGFIPLGQPPSGVGRRLATHGLHMGYGKELGRVLARDEVRSLCLSILNLMHPQALGLATRQGTTFELKKCLMLLIYFILRNVFYVSVKARNLCFINLENYECLSRVILSIDKALMEFALTILKN